MLKSGIYVIKNTVNGAVYVGSSIDLKRRELKHSQQIKKGTHANRYLARAIQKYGADNFIFKIIEKCEPSNLKEREQFYIEQYQAFGNGYNLLPLAYRNSGYRHTPEALGKISDASKGKTFTNEHKQRIADALRSYQRTAEHAQSISLAKIGQPSGFKGKHQPASAKARLREYAIIRAMPHNERGQFYATN